MKKQHIPKNIRKDMENPKKKSTYLEQCAKNKGLVDTDEGIRFVSPSNDDSNNVAVAAAASTKDDSGADGDEMMTKTNANQPSNNATTYSETALLERTRYELLNGRDFWMCTNCAVGVPSLTMPCGKCHKKITFVPLEIEEFEEFVQKQREMKRRADMMMLKRMENDSSSEESEEAETKSRSQNSRRLPCQSQSHTKH